MTVRELIEALSKVNPDLRVVVPTAAGNYAEARTGGPGWFMHASGAFEASDDDELADAFVVSNNA